MENPFVLGLSLVSDDEASRYLLSFQEFGVFQNIVRMNFYGSSDQVKFRYLANMKSSVHDVIEQLKSDIEQSERKKNIILIDDCRLTGFFFALKCAKNNISLSRPAE